MNRRIYIKVLTALIAQCSMCLNVFGQYDGLVINELLANPRNAGGVFLDSNNDSVQNVFDDEFIEFLNISTNDIDVAGLFVTDANTNIKRHVFSSRILRPNESMVVFGGGDILSFSNPPAQTASGSALSLNNNGPETIYLFAPDTQVVFQLGYNLSAAHDAISYTREPDGTGAFGDHITLSGGAARSSPGRRVQGHAFLTNQPPVLLDLKDETAFVGSELLVPIRAYDPADRDSVTLSSIGLPANATLGATGNVGSFSFTPASNQAGQVYSVSFIASDIDGAETGTIDVTVIDPVVNEAVWINEIHYDNESIDVNEGIEIAGSAGTDLSLYTLYLYDGTFLSVDGSNALSGTIDDEQCGFGAVWFPYPVNNIENGTEGIALVKGETLVQFISYEGAFTPDEGPANGIPSIDIIVDEEPAPAAGNSLQLTGTGATYNAFTWNDPLPHSRGTLNSGQVVACISPPMLDLQKTVYLGHDGGLSFPGFENVQGTNGAAITYAFLVANTGAVSVTNITITDVTLGIPPIIMGQLDAGQVKTSYLEWAISGDLRNTATVTGDGIYGGVAEDEDSAEVVEIIPLIDIQKTVYYGDDGGASCPGTDSLLVTNGSLVTYCFDVGNFGNTNLSSVTITDPDLGIPPIIIGDLLPGQTYQTSVTATVSASLTNQALVSSLDPNSDPVNDQDSAIVQLISPDISIEKTVSQNGLYPGGEFAQGTNGTSVTYWMVVSNSGDSLLTNISLLDSELLFTTNLGTLAAGGSLTVSVASVISGDVTNTASVTGEDLSGGLYSDADSAEVALMSPAIMVQKTAGRNGTYPGVEVLQGTNGLAVTYWMEVSNIGDVTLTNVFINDSTLSYSTNVGELVVNQVVTVGVVDVLSADFTNSVTVTGDDPNGASHADADTAEVHVVSPELALSKTVGLSGAYPGAETVQGANGSPVTYWIEVSNAGDVAITNVLIEDLDVLFSTNIGELVVGQVVTIGVADVISGALTNTASVSGGDPAGNIHQAEDTAEVVVLNPSIQVEKTVSEDGGYPGDEFVANTNSAPITYWFVALNDGDVSLTNVVLNDVAIGYWTNVGTLVSGQSITVSVADVINGDLTNVVTVTGEDPQGFVYEGSNTAVVAEILPPGIDLQKSVYLGHDGGAACPGLDLIIETNGAAVTYCFIVSNIGDVGLTNVVLQDPQLPGFVDVYLGDLPVGAVTGFHYESSINGDLVNVATVTAYVVGGNLITDDDLAEIEVQDITDDCGVYRIIDLGTLGGAVSRAYGINDLGDVVGQAEDANGLHHAFMWRNGTITNIMTDPNFTNSLAWDINRSLAVSGEVGTTNYTTRAFYLTTNELTIFGVLTNGNYSFGRGLNEVGESVGYADISSPINNRPIRWQHSVLEKVGTFTSCCGGGVNHLGDSGIAYDINDQGIAVGFGHIFCPNDCWDPFVWYDSNTNGVREQSELINLGNFGGRAGYAYGINELNEVVGFSLTNVWWGRMAFIVKPIDGKWNTGTWNSRNNPMIEKLGTLGGSESHAYAINDSSDVVGWAETTGSVRHAFLYTTDQMLDLNYLVCTNDGWVLQEARDINNSGEIVGIGTHHGTTRGFLLTTDTNWVELTRILYDKNEGKRAVYWRGRGARLQYRLLTATSMYEETWTEVTPTNLWPSQVPFYVDNTASNATLRFFRVEGESAEP